jgi:hypothetical protein
MLSSKIKLYCEANGKVYEDERDAFNIIVQDDMISGISSPYIKNWNVSGLSEPTDEQLNNLEAEATTLKNNYQVINTRKELYGTTAEQLEYIVENGVDAFITKQNQIKTDNPKG